MSMILIRAIVRPEKADIVLKSLLEAGYPAVTRVPVCGRGKQRGLSCAKRGSQNAVIGRKPYGDDHFSQQVPRERGQKHR